MNERVETVFLNIFKKRIQFSTGLTRQKEPNWDS